MVTILYAFNAVKINTFLFSDPNRAQKAIEKYTPLLQKAFETKGLTLGNPLFIRLFKEEKVLEVWVKKEKTYTLFKRYPICSYGSGGLGAKERG